MILRQRLASTRPLMCAKRRKNSLSDSLAARCGFSDSFRDTASPSTSSRAAAAPCLRLQSRRRGRPPAAAARCRVLQGRAAAPPRHSARAGYRRHTQPQSTGAFPRAPLHSTSPRDKQEARQQADQPAFTNKRNQPTFAYKCDAHRACRCEACGAVACVERPAIFVLQNNRTVEQWARGAAALKANSAVQNLRRVGHVRAGSMEVRRRGK